MRYTVIVEKGRASGYVAVCPALPGCASQGSALKNIREAIEVSVEALLDGWPIPPTGGRQ